MYLAWLPQRDTSTLFTLASEASFFSFRTRAEKRSMKKRKQDKRTQDEIKSD